MAWFRAKLDEAEAIPLTAGKQFAKLEEVMKAGHLLMGVLPGNDCRCKTLLVDIEVG